MSFITIYSDIFFKYYKMLIDKYLCNFFISISEMNYCNYCQFIIVSIFYKLNIKYSMLNKIKLMVGAMILIPGTSSFSKK